MMARYIVAYLAAGVTMGVLDSVWLTLSHQALYQAYLGAILSPTVQIAPAVAFYLVYLVGVVVFAIRPGPEGSSWRAVALRGALFGFVCYATYDLTNQATLVVWNWRVTVLDLAWGTALTAVASVAGRLGSARVKAD